MDLTINNLQNLDFEELEPDDFWTLSDVKEDKRHRIHSYPAKFPGFLVSKALEVAEQRNVDVKTIGDVFCGCGTTALEARKLNKDFWGWDINPVATLIAEVKSNYYQKGRLESYYQDLLKYLNDEKISVSDYYLNHERLKYWFSESQIKDLFRLKFSIEKVIPSGKYRSYFLCAFSNILKASSKWLTKSIKPQRDPTKNPQEVLSIFHIQYEKMLKAIEEPILANKKSNTKIFCENFLELGGVNSKVDLLITSPPYVTSYEYADLHQLSTLWLGYAKDYRELREGTIGSMYHEDKPVQNDIESLNEVGRSIFKELKKSDLRKALSVAKYFIDMDKAIQKCFSITKKNGINFFVIGNTSYKGVKVDNAKYLATSMFEAGFENINVYKREVGPKILTPYRDSKGRFSSNPDHRKVYNYEFVLIGQKIKN